MAAVLASLVLLWVVCAVSQPAVAAGKVDADSLAANLEEARSPDNLAMVLGLRRKIHQRPELMFHEFETSRLVQKTLAGLGIPFIPYFANTTGKRLREFFIRPAWWYIDLGVLTRMHCSQVWAPIAMHSKICAGNSDSSVLAVERILGHSRFALPQHTNSR